ncbi:MAG: ChbG/HpnK family deacetylase [Thermoguttaceae bacterium]|jgi:predicted glycoside hydrolase/deacetylase ChbG (UPF0249 family)
MGADGRAIESGPVRRIVLHADDLGLNRAVNDGILQAFRQGILTSTSVLANAPDAERGLEAWKELAQERSRGGLPSAARRRRLDDPDRPFDLGVHLNLTQGRPLTGDRYPAELLDAQGRFPGIFGLLARLRCGGRRFHQALDRELSCQIQVLLDHGQQPTHLNGHQYVELLPAVSRLLPAMLARFRIPAVRVAVERCWLPALGWPGVGLKKWLLASVQNFLARRFRGQIAKLPVSFPGAFFGTLTAGHTDLTKIQTFLAGGRRFDVTEIALHPALPAPPGSEADADGWHDPLASLRPGELQCLLSEELAECLEASGFRLGRMVP